MLTNKKWKSKNLRLSSVITALAVSSKQTETVKFIVTRHHLLKNAHLTKYQIMTSSKKGKKTTSDYITIIYHLYIVYSVKESETGYVRGCKIEMIIK